MKITEIPEELRKIYPIDIIGDIIKVTGKDGSTLSFTPEIVDNEIVGYDMEYLTKKEVKEIDKLNKKQEDILKQIEEIKSNGIQKKDEKEGTEDAEDAEDVEESEDKENTAQGEE